METHENIPPGEDASSEDCVARLVRQQSTLTELLRSVQDDARRLDASLDDAHEIAASICRVVRRSVFGRDGPLDLPAYQDNYDTFESACVDESDIHEVYADDLERYRKRQRKDLGLAESDSDKLTVVKRRRIYISALAALQAQVRCILDVLQAPQPS